MESNGRLEWDIDTKKFLQQRNLETGGKVQIYIDAAVLRHCVPYLPFDTGALQRTGDEQTVLGSGRVWYGGNGVKYAARLYYHPEYNFNRSYRPYAGAYWFERMKVDKSNEILEGAKKIAGAK